jgi:radical SAM family uncharacterized protein
LASNGEPLEALPGALTELLARVVRPGRYVGGEFNQRRKPEARPRIVLSYPDVYEIGIANPGLQIIYSGLNDGTSAVAERAYCPWPDMAALMRAAGQELWTLETYSPVREADLWGFTLQHELTYTNVLEMLDLAGVPLHAVDRGASDPIVLGGGPCSANPLPMARFFDAFFIGEAEERLAGIVEALGAPSRAQRLDRLAEVPGMWLPRRSSGVARRQVFTGFARSLPVTEPLVPLLEAVHDRAVIEIMRGCTAGCRFCQAGSWYRPLRERPPDTLVESALAALRSTGSDEVSLLSLSSCDYSGIEEVVNGIRSAAPGARVSLPSLRVDSAAVVLSRLGDSQRGGVTLAPEAGSQGLRDAINKQVTQEAFDDAVTAVGRAGFTSVKLYYMIGLPGETDADVSAIAAMVIGALRRVRETARGRLRISVSVSSFVPKPQTPFEREPFAGDETITRRQQLLREALPREVRLSLHDVRSSTVEAFLAGGDRDLGATIEAAWRQGARFDGWTEGFDLRLWRAAALETGVELESDPSRPRDRLPWRVIDGLVDPAYLEDERRRSLKGESTPDCRDGACPACGVCRDDIANDLAGRR